LTSANRRGTRAQPCQLSQTTGEKSKIHKKKPKKTPVRGEKLKNQSTGNCEQLKSDGKKSAARVTPRVGKTRRRMKDRRA